MSMSFNVRGTEFDFSLDGIGFYEAEAAVFGGLWAALQGGVLIQLFADPNQIKMFGAMVGTWNATFTGGWIVLELLGVLFALPFLVVVSGTINSFANSVIMLSSRVSLLQKILVPLLRRAALAITAAGIGNLYGLVIGLTFYAFFFPAWLHWGIGYSAAVPFPNFDLVGIMLGWFLGYGGSLGLVYGFALEA